MSEEAMAAIQFTLSVQFVSVPNLSWTAADQENT